MTIHRRHSPVSFTPRPAKTEMRDGWEVVLEYKNEKDGPFLIDLSHRAKWDIQDGDLSKIHPWRMAIPEMPGQCHFQDGYLINRMNRTQAACWHLSGAEPENPDGTPYTDTTDASVLLALVGTEVFSILEKVTSLDFRSPDGQPPLLLQGPVLHVPCQVVLLGEVRERVAVLFTCSRGYGQSMVAGILEAGEEWGLCPAGEKAFQNWLKGLQT